MIEGRRDAGRRFAALVGLDEGLLGGRGVVLVEDGDRVGAAVEAGALAGQSSQLRAGRVGLEGAALLKEDGRGAYGVG